MNILFLSRWFPYPPDNGSKIRIFNLIKQLAQYHKIYLISFASEKVSDDQLAALHPYCRQVDVVTYKPFQPGRVKALLGFFSWQPRSVIDTYNPNLQRLVERISYNQTFEVVIASQIDMAPYISALPGPVKVLEELELTTLYEQFATEPHPLKRWRSGLTWWKLTHYLRRLLPTFDGCTVVSGEELERIKYILPHYQPLAVIPNGVDTGYYAASWGNPVPDTLIYSGALTYEANFDAVDFFLQEVFPLIQIEQPQVKLMITGKLEGVPVERLPQSNQGVVFTGYLPDIRPAVAGSWVSVVPLRKGGGTRLKILEALALGTPVVSTRKGAEGLNLVPDRDILIADRPADFAAAILRLLQDTSLRETLSRNGRRVVETHYDWQIIGQQFSEFIEHLTGGQ